jgi:hypothetical protein
MALWTGKKSLVNKKESKMFNNRKMGSSDSLLDTIKDIMEKKHTTPETPKEKSLAKLAHPKDKITHKDVLVGRGVLKKENSGDRMGVIVGTRKEKVELEPKLKEGKVDELKQSTVKSYTDKANKQLKKIGKKMMDDPDDHDGLDDKEKNTLRKRMAGFDMTFRKGIRASQKTTKEEVENVDERKLTGAEAKKKEKYVLSMKKKMGGFKQRYGDRAKEVMYATATKMAKEDVDQVDETSDVKKMPTNKLQAVWNRHKDEQRPAPAFAAHLKKVNAELTSRKKMAKDK